MQTKREREREREKKERMKRRGSEDWGRREIDGGRKEISHIAKLSCQV